jgi:hypothetical protein
VVSSFEHIPTDLPAHELLYVAGGTVVGPMIEGAFA